MNVNLKSGPEETFKKSKIIVAMFRDEMVNFYTLAQEKKIDKLILK
jgi:hypothetical protein